MQNCNGASVCPALRKRPAGRVDPRF
jgi:hypothetical protein